jgi:hypothetical protein
LPDTKRDRGGRHLSDRKILKEAIAKEAEPLSNRISFSRMIICRLMSCQGYAAAAVGDLLELMIVDAAGAYEGGTPLARLHAVASADFL